MPSGLPLKWEVSFLLVQAEIASLRRQHGRKSLPCCQLRAAIRLNLDVRAMARVLTATVLFLAGLLFAYRGVAAWLGCGYDCAALLTWLRLTARVAVFLVLLLLGIGILAFISILGSYLHPG